MSNINDIVVSDMSLLRKAKTIQNLWNYRKYSKLIVDNYLNFVLGGKPFDEIQSLILNKKIINECYIFLKSLFNYIKLTVPSKCILTEIDLPTSRKYLVYLLLLYHPKNILGERDIKTDICQKLLNMVRLFHSKRNFLYTNKYDKQSMIDYCINFQLYIKLFDEWKENDVFNTVQNFTHNYWELELASRQDYSSLEDNGDATREEIQRQQNQLLENIKIIGGEKGMQQFNDYVPIVYTDTFMDNIRNTLENAFWDTVREELYGNPPKTDKFKNTFNEMKTLLKDIDTRETFKTEVDEYLDSDYIINMISNEAYTQENMINTLHYLANQILRLDSEINDQKNCEKFDEIAMEILDIYEESDTDIKEKGWESWMCTFQFMIPKMKEILDIKNYILDITKD